MPTLSITATYLARNLSDLLNQVRYQRVTLEVTRGSDLIAYVCPSPAMTGYPINQLDRLLASLPQFSTDEVEGFLADTRAGVASQSAEPDTWD
jgi:hypothetical protein